MALRNTLREYLFIILTAVVSMFAILGLAYGQYQENIIQTRAAFSSDAKERLDLINDTINDNLAMVDSLVSFYSASQKVNKQDFTAYVGDILKSHPYIEAIAWAPVVKNADRASFEKREGFKITQKSATSNFMVPADSRSEYVPITYIQPLRNRAILGFDYSSSSVREKGLLVARQTGLVTATEGVTLITSNQKGVLLFAPVYNGNEVSGFIVCIMPMRTLIDRAIEPLTPRGNSVTVYDITADKSLLHVRPSRIANMTQQQVIDLYNTNSSMRASRVIEVAGRKWEVTVLASKGFYTLGADRQIWIILIFGILFTTMLTYYMVHRLRQNNRIMEEVESRTRELSHTKKELELILNSTMDGIIGIDKNAQIVFCNLMAPLLLGYKKSEILDQNFHKLIQRVDGDKVKSDKTGVQRALEKGMENKAVTHEVFWRRNNMAMKVEYSISSLVEDNIITGAVIVFRDISERKQHEENLEQMALYDQLTQVANRRQFIELLKKSLSRAHRIKKHVGIIYMDLNDFKEINDTRGHATGDLVLKSFAERLKSGLREYDTIARLGGDEFAIIADALTMPSECATIVERLLNLLKKPLVTRDGEFQISTSIGISTYPEDGNNYDTLITAADTAMYAAKKDKSIPYLFYEKDQ